VFADAKVYELADAAAVPNFELAMFQMLLTLPPAPMNKAAEANATKASSNVYSIRSCPSSPRRKFLSIV
jgi:hypothetical protein